MPTCRQSICSAWIAWILVPAMAVVSEAGTFTYIEPNGAANTEVFDISGNKVVGFYDAGGNSHAFVFDGLNYTTIDPPGSIASVARAVSGNVVVGYYFNTGGGPGGEADLLGSHGFLYNGSNFITIDPPGSRATVPYAVSGNKVVGYYFDGPGAFTFESANLKGFVFDGVNYTTLNPPDAVASVFALGVSGNNVVGNFKDGVSGKTRGFLFDGSTYTTLIPPGSTASGTNSVSGNITVGSFDDSSSSLNSGRHGFIYNGSSYTTFDVPGKQLTEPTGISGNYITGFHYNGSRVGGFLFDGTTFTDIDVPGSSGTQPNAISGNKVAGVYRNGSPVHGFVYEFDVPPVPEPGSLTLLGIGVLTIAARRLRRNYRHCTARADVIRK